MGQSCILCIKYSFPHYCSFSSVSRNWTDAQKICQDQGGVLFFPEPNEPKLNVVNAAEEIFNDIMFWIGISDLETEGQWKYSNGALITNTTFVGSISTYNYNDK